MSHDAVLDCFRLAPDACEDPPPSTSAVDGAGSGAGGATSGALKVVILRAGAGAVAGAAPLTSLIAGSKDEVPRPLEAHSTIVMRRGLQLRRSGERASDRELAFLSVTFCVTVLPPQAAAT